MVPSSSPKHTGTQWVPCPAYSFPPGPCTRQGPTLLPSLVAEAQQGVPHSGDRGKWDLTHSVATKTAVWVAGKARFSIILLLPLALSFNNSSDHRVRADQLLSEAGGWASRMIALPTSRLTSGQLMVTTS